MQRQAVSNKLVFETINCRENVVRHVGTCHLRSIKTNEMKLDTYGKHVFTLVYMLIWKTAASVSLINFYSNGA